MAKFYPDFENIKKLKQPPTAGELHALEILAGLPDAYEVYFQPFVNGYNPDIVIMRKNYGLLVIEVKDWQLIHYLIDDEDNWVLRKENIPIKSPIKQVSAYKDDLYNLSVPSLLRGKVKNSKYYGIVQTAVYFHNENSSSLNKNIKSTIFCPIFGKDNFNINDLTQDHFILKKYPNKLFKTEIYQEIKRVLKPSFHTLEQAQEVRLSKKQKLLAKSDRRQQKIRGVAGSGKTLVLAQRAVNSYTRHNEKVLILTFNITLRNYIHDNLNRVRREFDWKYFHITHYHQFILSEANNHNITHVDFDNIDLYERVKNKIHKYQSIFIDEIQDYQEEWIRIIKKYFLVDGGEFVVFGDEKQNIYDKKLDNNQKPNTTIRGAWTKLDQSFRLSNKILKLAEDFQSKFFSEKYELDKAIPKQQTVDDFIPEDNIEYYKMDDNSTIPHLSNFLISKFKENSIQPQDICILAQSNILLRGLDFEIRKETAQKTYTTLETQEMYQYLMNVKKLDNSNLAKQIRMIRRNKRFNFWMNSGGIKLSTVHSFKGWEISTLFLIIDSESTHETHELVYTAITRCRNRLFIIDINNCSIYDDFFNSILQPNNIVKLEKEQPNKIQDETNHKTIKDLVEENTISDICYNFSKLKLNRKFIILALGEISGSTNNFKKELNSYFSKFNIKAQEWDIEFWNNKTIKKKDLRCLKKGQTKYNLIVTGQIHQHSSKGNKQSNLLTELMKPQYVKRIYGSRPQNLLTADLFVSKIDEYISKSHNN